MIPVGDHCIECARPLELTRTVYRGQGGFGVRCARCDGSWSPGSRTVPMGPQERAQAARTMAGWGVTLALAVLALLALALGSGAVGR